MRCQNFIYLTTMVPKAIVLDINETSVYQCTIMMIYILTDTYCQMVSVWSDIKVDIYNVLTCLKRSKQFIYSLKIRNENEEAVWYIEWKLRETDIFLWTLDTSDIINYLCFVAMLEKSINKQEYNVINTLAWRIYFIVTC